MIMKLNERANLTAWVMMWYVPVGGRPCPAALERLGSDAEFERLYGLVYKTVNAESYRYLLGCTMAERVDWFNENVST